MSSDLRLIIDTDPGVDDAMAILMALAHPEVRVEAITTVAGNVGLEHTTRNAGAILDVARADVPVFAGAAGPLLGSVLDAAHVHGADGLGDCGRSSSERQPEGDHAANAILRLTREAPGDLTLVCLGPLTNVALAMRLDAELPRRVKRLVVMGGAIRATGNSSDVAEFNIHADPEAAAVVVLGTWPDVTLVTWEATLAHPLEWSLLERGATDSMAAEFVLAISAHAREYARTVLRSESLFVPDPLAMAVALEPSIVTEAVEGRIGVELCGALTRGQTVLARGAGGDHGNVRVVERVDVDRLSALVSSALT